jgi:hypothetical protein
MKNMVIFEPAMCCSTGVCGPSVDKELLRISTVLDNLNKNGVMVERYNLTSNPQIFVDNKTINELLDKEGSDVLPVTMVDGTVVKKNDYPTNQEFCQLLDIPKEFLKSEPEDSEGDCCAGSDCC